MKNLHTKSKPLLGKLIVQNPAYGLEHIFEKIIPETFLLREVSPCEILGFGGLHKLRVCIQCILIYAHKCCQAIGSSKGN